MMIDEAIKHCLEVAEKNDGEAEVYDLLAKNHNNPYEKLTASRFYTDCAECAADHRQLAEWLMEYKDLKNSIGAVKLSNMKEALELIRAYKAENIAQKKLIAEYKRLLKLAVEDFDSVVGRLEGNDILCMKYIACEGCPFNGENCNKWRYANEVLKLIES